MKKYPLFDLSIEKKKEIYPYWRLHIEKQMKNPVLRQLNIQLTKQCNEHCLHCVFACDNKKSQDELTDDEIIDCLVRLKIDTIKDNGIRPLISFTGGEVLLHDTFLKLGARVHELGYDWVFATNGLLLTKEKLKNMIEAGLVGTSISIDGLENTHNWFRQTTDCFNIAIKNIRECLTIDSADKMLGVTTVAHKRNLAELENIYNLLKELGVKNWKLLEMEPVGRAEINKDLLLSVDEYRQFLNFVIDKISKREMNIYIVHNHYLGLFYEGKATKSFHCESCGYEQMGISCTGDIVADLTLIGRPENHFGNIRTDNLYDVWKNKFEIFRQDKSLNSEKCSKCSERERCGGSGWHTWDFDKWEPAVCMFEELHKPNTSGNFSSLIRKAKERA